MPSNNNVLEDRWQIVPTHGGTPTTVWQLISTCTGSTVPWGRGVTWNHAGDAATFTLGTIGSGGSVVSGLLREWKTSGTILPKTLAGFGVTEARYSADDKVIALYQFDNLNPTFCQEAIRDLRSGSFGNLIGNPISVALNLCTQYGPRTVQPNLRRSPSQAGPVALTGGSLAQISQLPSKARLHIRVN